MGVWIPVAYGKRYFYGMLRRVYLLLNLLALSSVLPAQTLAGAKNLDKALLINVGYGRVISAGDLTDRFGNGFAIDGGVAYLLKNSNWQFGIRAVYGFGTEVKEDVLADLRTRDGFIVGNQREPADVQLRQRQLFIGPSVGYTFRLGGNQRSGINLRTSIGYYAHRIRLQRDVVQGVAPLYPELIGGYDRLTGGPAWYQFVGYQTLSRDRRINFYVGADVLFGLTKPLRAFDVPTGAPLPDEVRGDANLGVRAGLIIPLYFGEGRQIFYK